MADGATSHRQGYSQAARDLLANDAHGRGLAAIRSLERAWLLGDGFRQDVQELGQRRPSARDESAVWHGCFSLFSAAGNGLRSGREILRGGVDHADQRRSDRKST